MSGVQSHRWYSVPMVRLVRRSLFPMTFVMLAPFACTSFGSEPGDATDAASPPQPTATTIPTSPPGLLDGALPDGLAPDDVVTPPPRDADRPDATVPRACVGSNLFATGFEGTPFPPTPFTNAGTSVPQLSTSRPGFTGNSVGFALPTGSASKGMLAASVELLAGTRSVCVEGRVQLKAGSPTVMGAEIDVMRITVGGVTVRIAFSSRGTFLASSSPPNSAVFSVSNVDRPYHWIVRLNGTTATFSLDGIPIQVPAVLTAPLARMAFEVGIDATGVADAAAVQSSSMAFDDLYATAAP